MGQQRSPLLWKRGNEEILYANWCVHGFLLVYQLNLSTWLKKTLLCARDYVFGQNKCLRQTFGLQCPIVHQYFLVDTPIWHMVGLLFDQSRGCGYVTLDVLYPSYSPPSLLEHVAVHYWKTDEGDNTYMEGAGAGAALISNLWGDHSILVGENFDLMVADCWCN